MTSEPQVPLTAQEWLKQAALQINRLILAACTMGSQSADCNEFERIKDADIDRIEAALLDHLAVRSQEQEAEEIPDDEHTRFILGFMCFQAAVIAHTFRADGAQIDRKAEAEQAFVIRKMLNAYLAHGEGWRKAFGDELEALSKRRHAAIAAQAAQPKDAA